MNKQEVFENEIVLIKNEDIRESLRVLIDKIPDYFFTIPAASTGKYHPSYAQGDGGLVRHTKAAVKIAYELLADPAIGNKYTDDDICDIYPNRICDNCGDCLKEEGIDRNHFVSLIVNNAGTYTAAITRKVTSQKIGKNNFSYPTFDDKIINRNIEVFNAYLKTMGYKLQQSETIKEIIFDCIDNDLHERELPDGEKVLVTDEKYIELLVEYKVDKYFEEEIFIGTMDEYEELRKELFEKFKKELNETSYEL